MSNNTINLYSNQELSTLTYWPKFKSEFNSRPTSNYEYACLFIDTLKNSHLPLKVQQFNDFTLQNSLHENLEKNCLGKRFYIGRLNYSV
jgi:hypothetical protein